MGSTGQSRGRMKTFLDYLPEELRGAYSRLLEGTHSDK